MTRAHGLLLFCAACACAPEPAPPADDAPYAVVDGAIEDADGRTVLLRGVNLSGMHKVPPYFDFHEAPDFAAVRTRLGMNSLRFLLEWAAVEPTRGAYDDDYLDDVRTRLDWAHDAGLLVVLDMHQDLYGEGFLGGNGAPRWTCDEARYADYEPPDDWFLGYLDPNVTACFDGLWTDEALQDDFARMWRHVAEAFADHPAVIGFEPINEPWQGSFSLETFEPAALQPFYERVVPAVREAAPHWLAFLEPSSMSNLGRDSLLAPFPFDDVVYAPHAYDASFERGEGFDDDNRTAAFDKLEKLAAEARGMGAALWIGEYGGDARLPGIEAYMDAEVEAASAVFAGSAYWDASRGEGFGLYDDDGLEKPAIADAIVRAGPERVAGALTRWATDDGGALTVAYTARGDAPTVLVAPARAFPHGVVVDCDGCSARVDGDVIEVEHNDGVEDGDTISVIVRPAP